MRIGQRLLAATLTLCIVLAACSSESRPSIEEWEQNWNAVLAIVPDLETMGPNPPEEICENVLASLRSEKETLFPPPDPTIDDTVTQWVETAEAAFFDCPPSGELDGFAGAYAVMLRLQEEIETVLDIDRG